MRPKPVLYMIDRGKSSITLVVVIVVIVPDRFSIP